jgi:hypothetical protein
MFDNVPAKRPRGRPSLYAAEVADEICRRVALGESLRSICSDKDMPPEGTVRGWVVEDYSGFSARYMRAREAQCEHWADQIVDLADSVLPRDGRPADHAEVQAMRLAIDTRKWVLSKLLPRKYGDRVGVEASGSVTVKVVQGLGDDEKQP